MEDFKINDLTRKEVIDGVTIVYTGLKIPIHKLRFSWESEGRENLNWEWEEIVEMYDANGNRFYSNYESLDKANKAIEKLASQGITAVIGPKAPWRGYDGKMIQNRSENDVGVFVVQVPEKDEDFKINDSARKEVIDGVTVVYTGLTEPVHQGYKSKFSWEGGGYEDLGWKQQEVVEMYDANGNRFYSNYESLDEANKTIEELASRGITAVIGPKAPWRGYDGKMIQNRSENDVGVFVVQVPEKDEALSQHKTR